MRSPVDDEHLDRHAGYEPGAEVVERVLGHGDARLVVADAGPLVGDQIRRDGNDVALVLRRLPRAERGEAENRLLVGMDAIDLAGLICASTTSWSLCGTISMICSPGLTTPPMVWTAS